MSTDLSALLRLGLALVLAGILGWERETLGKPAGLRTHILVGVGAALAVAIGDGLINQYAAHGGGLRFDPLRIIEAVLTGIGFIGAGTIMFRRGQDRVTGLTTAASLWATATVGLAVGAGRLVLATGATVIIFIVLRVLGWLETRTFHTTPEPHDSAG